MLELLEEELLLDEELDEEELEQLLELDELELELSLEDELLLEFEELLELEQLDVAGGIKGVVRSAPQPCSNRVASVKNANALNVFDWRIEKLIIAV